jgi:hypothetical protein
MREQREALYRHDTARTYRRVTGACAAAWSDVSVTGWAPADVFAAPLAVTASPLAGVSMASRSTVVEAWATAKSGWAAAIVDRLIHHGQVL